jgi:hypothetical protein
MPEVVRFAIGFSPYLSLDSLFGKRVHELLSGRFRGPRSPGERSACQAVARLKGGAAGWFTFSVGAESKSE